MKPKQDLDAYIRRLNKITETVTTNETHYGRRHFYKFPMTEDDEQAVEPQPAASQEQPLPDNGQQGEQPVDTMAGDDMGAGTDDVGAGDDTMGVGDESIGGDEMGATGQDMTGGDTMGAGADETGGGTEIDVSELVHSTREASEKVDNVIGKMDKATANINSILQKFHGLDANLQTMNTALDNLTKQVRLMRPPTEDERRKVVQQSSYPFNQSLQDAAQNKHLTQTDLENEKNKFNVNDIVSGYNQSDIKNSF